MAHFINRVLASAALALWLSPSSAQPDTYPSRPIQFIVPAGVGGGADQMARMFADKLGGALGQPVFVVNAPGASGVIGMQKVTDAKADGYNVLFGFNQLTTVNPHLIPNLKYNIEKDLQPVSLLAEQTFVWIASNKFAAKTVPEWITLAKKDPKKVTFAHNGVSSFANLGAELFMQLTGSEMLAVPYKDSATPDLVSGVVDLKMEPASIALPLIKTGRVKALAVTSPGRLASLPDVPAMAEFFPGYVFHGSYSVWLRTGTPAPIVDRLSAELTKIARQPAFAERVAELSIKAVGSDAGELRAATRKESQLWERLIKSRNIKVEP